MKRGLNFRLIAFATLGFLLLIAAFLLVSIPKTGILLGPLDGTTSARSFSSLEIKRGALITVMLNVEFEEGTPFYDLLELVNQGFQIIDTGDGTLRPDIGPDAIQFLNFNPQNITHSYILNSTACSGDYDFSGIYLAPPETTRQIMGQKTIIIIPGEVTRTFLNSSPIFTGETLSVHLDVYVACEESYQIEETVPLGWTIIDSDGGTINSNIITWPVGPCGGPCGSNSYTYKIQTTSTGLYSFSGIYSMDESPTATILGDTTMEVIPASGCFDWDSDNYDNCDSNNPEDTDGLPTDCNNANSTIHPDANEVCVSSIDFDCDGEPQCKDSDCNNENCMSNPPAICYNEFCALESCNQPGFYCSGGPIGSGDLMYPPGDSDCNPPDTFCYQDLPDTLSCTDLGGICDLEPADGCPTDTTHYAEFDATCPGYGYGGPDPNPQCCITPFESCSDISGTCLPDNCLGGISLPLGDLSCLLEGLAGEDHCCELTLCDSFGGECTQSGCGSGQQIIQEGNPDCYNQFGFDWFCCGII